MYHVSKWTIFSDITPLKFNYFVSAIASFLFFAGWWIIVDAIVQFSNVFDATRTYHLPGILGTVSMVCVLMVPSGLLYDSSYYADTVCCTPFFAKTILFILLMASFGCLIGATFILFYDFLLDPSRYQYPGYGIIVQNLCIFMCTMLLKFGKKRDI